MPTTTNRPTLFRLKPADHAQLRKVFSRHLQEDERNLLWQDLGLDKGRCPDNGETLEVRWSATLDAVVAQGEALFRRLIELAVERAPVLSKDEVVERFFRLGEEELKRYLSVALAHHRHLPLIGVNPELKLTLDIDDVYVPIKARVHRGLYQQQPDGFCAEQLETSKHRKRRPTGGNEGRESAEPEIDLTRAFATAAAQKKRGVVILGDPGSGKTTLLKLLLVRCIQQGDDSLGLPREVVPVLLPLRDLEATDSSLSAFCQRILEGNKHLSLSPGFADALRRKRPVLYLLDGLDEVPDETRRAGVSRWIQLALSTYENAWFAVSSRYAGYQGAARMDDHFLELNIRPLKALDAKRLVERFYAIVERHQLGDTSSARVSAEDKSAALWRLFESEQYRTRRMRELQTNPLLLTILCLVHQRFNALPEERWRIYEWCIDTLLWHWQKAKGLELPFQKLEDARKLLLPFAYWLHQKDERRQATTDEVVAALEESLGQLAVKPERMRKFLEAIRDRSGLLEGRGQDSYGFIHLAFQEFLTALQLKILSHGRPEVLDAAASRFGESWWTEVILLLVSLPEPSMFEPFMRRLVLEDRFARPEYRQLLSDCVSDASVKSPLPFLEVVSDETRGAEVHLAALTAIRGMGDESGDRVVSTCRQLLEHSPHKAVKDLARELLAARGVTFSKPLEAGDPWVHEATGLGFVHVPPGSFMMGSDHGYSDEKPIHKVTFARGFWIGKYPVTNAQYERFMKQGGGREPDLWRDSQWNGPEQPVVGVTWDDAFGYCRWASEVLLRGEELPAGGASGIVLPSEAEWEYAARGPESREYPWGKQGPTKERANYGASEIGRTTPVGQYPDGASWVGALDMAGNVWEWCADHWHDDYEGSSRPDDGRPWLGDGVVPEYYKKHASDPNNIRVIRGGCWDIGAGGVRSAFRGRELSWDGIRYRGFRVLAAALPVGDP